MSDATRKHFVFISHSSRDNVVTRRVAHGLEIRGFDCWWDEKNLEPGHDLSDEIKTAIRKSTLLLIVTTSSAAGSTWVHKEFEFAMGSPNKPTVLPLILERGTGACWLDQAKGYELLDEESFQGFLADFSSRFGSAPGPLEITKPICDRHLDTLIRLHPNLKGAISELMRRQKLPLGTVESLSPLDSNDSHALASSLDTLSFTCATPDEIAGIGICSAALYPSTGIGLSFARRVLSAGGCDPSSKELVFSLLCCGRHKQKESLLATVELARGFVFRRPADIGSCVTINAELFDTELHNRLAAILDQPMPKFSLGYLELVADQFRRDPAHPVLYGIIHSSLFTQRSVWPYDDDETRDRLGLIDLLDELQGANDEPSGAFVDEFMSVFKRRSRSECLEDIIACVRMAMAAYFRRSKLGGKMADILGDSMCSAERKRHEETVRNSVFNLVTALQFGAKRSEANSALNEALKSNNINCCGKSWLWELLWN
jgi:hypothetical protein